MARFGDTVNPSLGATDFSNFLRGSQQGSAAMGRGIQQLGAGAGQFAAGIGEAKKQKAGFISLMDAVAKNADDPAMAQWATDQKAQAEVASLRDAAGMAKAGREALQFLGQQARAAEEASRFDADLGLRAAQEQRLQGQADLDRQYKEWIMGQPAEGAQAGGFSVFGVSQGPDGTTVQMRRSGPPSPPAPRRTTTGGLGPTPAMGQSTPAPSSQEAYNFDPPEVRGPIEYISSGVQKFDEASMSDLAIAKRKGAGWRDTYRDLEMLIRETQVQGTGKGATNDSKWWGSLGGRVGGEAIQRIAE